MSILSNALTDRQIEMQLWVYIFITFIFHIYVFVIMSFVFYDIFKGEIGRPGRAGPNGEKGQSVSSLLTVCIILTLNNALHIDERFDTFSRNCCFRQRKLIVELTNKSLLCEITVICGFSDTLLNG